MTIDSLYNNIDKITFTLEEFLRIYRDNSVAQVENLSLLAHRKMVDEVSHSNTINYLVVIESVKGVFLGEVFQTKVPSSENLHDSINHGKTETVFPEINIDIIGLMSYCDKNLFCQNF